MTVWVLYYTQQNDYNEIDYTEIHSVYIDEKSANIAKDKKIAENHWGQTWYVEEVPYHTS